MPDINKTLPPSPSSEPVADLVKRLLSWLDERAGPDSGLDFEAGGYGFDHRGRSDRCTVFGSDATFVRDNFHGKGARDLATAIEALVRERDEALAELEVARKAFRDASDSYSRLRWPDQTGQ